MGDYELTLQNSLSKEWVLEPWLAGENKTHKQEFALMMLAPLIKFYKEVVKTDDVVICDSYAMAVALDRSIGLDPSELEVCVETFRAGTRYGTRPERSMNIFMVRLFS